MLLFSCLKLMGRGFLSDSASKARNMNYDRGEPGKLKS